MSTIEIPFAPHCALQAEALEGGIVRIRASGLDGPSETLLERYRFLKPLAPAAGCQAAGDRLMLADGSALRLDKHGGFQLVDAAGTTIVATTTGTKPGTAATATGNAGWQLSLPMAESEKIIGGGDHRRDRLLLNGERSQLWVRYQLSHVPVPLFLSSRGYGLFFNTTRRVLYDIGATTPGVQTYKVAKDYLDVYIIRGASYDEIIASYCSLTGLPPLPSERSFGGWLLANEFSNGQEVVALARNLRTARIPMDHIGLEPYWMDTRYDFSADKQWSKTRFLHWGDKGGPVSMIKTLARQGFTLGLWLCSKWDLTWEEERRIGADTQSGDEIFDMSDIEMTHFDDNVGHKPIRMDDLTKRDEPWFEHLKTFIDHGVRFFKLDPAVLINEFPDRLYGNGRTLAP
jgi:alpha-glucosidase